MTNENARSTPEQRPQPSAPTAGAEGICILNQDARIVYASARAALLLGWSGDQLLGAHVQELLPPQELVLEHGQPHILLRALHSAAPLFVQRGHLLHRDGVRLLVEFNCLPLRDAGRWNGAAITFWSSHHADQGELGLERAPDTQQLVSMLGELAAGLTSVQAELHALRQALPGETQRLHEAQEALRSRDTFLAVAVHELKTPVTLMLGYTQLLERRIARLQDGGNDRPLRVVVQQAHYLNEMLGSLFDISQMQRGEMIMSFASVDLTALIREIERELSTLLQQHQLQIVLPDRPPRILGDRLRLKQVLNNLLQNAFMYSAEGSGVELRLDVEDALAVIAVTDHGSGNSPSTLTELFENFSRTRRVPARRATGMGIGLSVVKEIVLLHEGRVDVESTEGFGSTFKIYLPLED